MEATSARTSTTDTRLMFAFRDAMTMKLRGEDSPVLQERDNR